MPHQVSVELVILTSTFPRWVGDSVPRFVEDFALRMRSRFRAVTVIAPHYRGSAAREGSSAGITIKRFRYAIPASQENIVYEGHAATKARARPVYALKLLLLLASSFRTTVVSAFRRNAVVNAHWIIPQGAVALAARPLTGAPVVVTVHGGDVFTLNARLLRRVKRWVLKKADVVVVNSSATLQACRQLYPDRTYEVIPMGVDTTAFHPAPAALAGSNEVLFVGRLSPEKGAHYLLEAAAAAIERGASRFRVRIVGDGPQRAQLEAYAEAHGISHAVTFDGWVAHEDLPPIYRQATVFTGPSIIDDNGWSEAFGLTFAEASACGLPVIATRTGGISDIVKDGETGLLVDQRSSDQLLEALLALLEDSALCERLGSQGARHVAENFSWDAVVERYAAIIDGLRQR